MNQYNQNNQNSQGREQKPSTTTVSPYNFSSRKTRAVQSEEMDNTMFTLARSDIKKKLSSFSSFFSAHHNKKLAKEFLKKVNGATDMNDLNAMIDQEKINVFNLPDNGRTSSYHLMLTKFYPLTHNARDNYNQSKEKDESINSNGYSPLPEKENEEKNED